MSRAQQASVHTLRPRVARRYEIYRGITTGLNEAFIVDNQTKEELVAEDPRSAEILKPLVRGRDIGRYRAQWAGMWIIDAHNGYDSVPPIDIDNYPAVKNHLDQWWQKLEKRYDKGRTPYNLRSCAYHSDFEKDKLLWIELVGNGRFAYDNTGLYGEATTFLLTGVGLKYLCAVLNSKLISWFLETEAPTSGMGILRWKKVYVERIPIPKVSDTEQGTFIALVDRILSANDLGHLSERTVALEQDIDQLVYNIYGLTEEEQSMVAASIT